jgi:beta-N-acetylhexosaminidase
MYKQPALPKLSDLSIDQKIAQMLLIGFRGFEITPDNPIVNDIRKLEIGGIILFDYDVVLKSYDRNVRSPEQLSHLMGQLYALFPAATFVSIDQEGGTVNRLKPEYGFEPTFSHKELGEKDDVDFTRKHSRQIAKMLKKYGININFAPCLDLGINKENKAIYLRNRTFSDVPEKVALHGAAYIEGHREEGVLTCVKHFPGHGSSLADTHLGMADVTDSWQSFEMHPYEHIIAEGLCDMVMTTHIFNRTLDDVYPATMSARIMQGILRDKLGYKDVIISDDLQMQAITNHFGLEQAVEQTILAGVDILAIGNNLVFEPDVATRCIVIVKDLLDKGILDEARIDQSVERILRMKQKI